MAKRRIYCNFCDNFYYDPSDYVAHLEKKHHDMIPEDMDAWEFSYFLRTGKNHGTCIICKKPTGWNEKTHKYHRFCKNPQCKEKYREQFKKNMIGKHGKITLLNDPQQQRVMLSKRSISSEYLWSDRVHKFTYTGTYERDFLEFLDHVMDWDPEDLFAPSPHTYYYEYEGKKHFYFPDFFIPSLNLEIEIKDGTNTHPNRVGRDAAKEKLKDDVMWSIRKTMNYIKIVEKDNKKFLQALEIAKINSLEGKELPIYLK